MPFTEIKKESKLTIVGDFIYSEVQGIYIPISDIKNIETLLNPYIICINFVHNSPIYFDAHIHSTRSIIKELSRK